MEKKHGLCWEFWISLFPIPGFLLGTSNLLKTFLDPNNGSTDNINFFFKI